MGPPEASTSAGPRSIAAIEEVVDQVARTQIGDDRDDNEAEVVESDAGLPEVPPAADTVPSMDVDGEFLSS